MAIQTLQGTPVDIDLIALSKTNGWSIMGNKAIHETCNDGEIKLNGLTLVTGKTYEFTYMIDSISGGYIEPRLGTATGTQQTTSGFKSQMVTVTGTNPTFRFYSNANATIRVFTIKDTAVDTNVKQRNSVVYDESINKWKYFMTYVPDCGTSLFTNTYTFKAGRLYLHQHNSNDRNNFAGVQYPSTIRMVFNANPNLSKTYQSISYQANQLWVTSEDGITTSLGQVSELIDIDFLKATLTDGVTTIKVNDTEGIYSASFLRDKNDDIINGSPLKGNTIEIELVTTDGSVPVTLYTVATVTNISKVGAR